MPGFLYVRSRVARAPALSERSHLATLARRLTPDNIAPRLPAISERDDGFLTVFNGGPMVRRERTSVCLGSIFGCAESWWKVGSAPPDGSFGLLRSDDRATELVSDTAGTHTLWYAQTDDEFVASTSQRAIVMWLKSYACNREVLAWQLSSGTLGPGLSWDSRIRALPPASRLVFDRGAWAAQLRSEPVEYRPSAESARHHREALLEAITDTFRRLELDTDHAALALSGGYDSRMILLMLKGRSRLHTVTWGQRGALADRRNDACIAQRLASKLNTDHAYLEIEMPAAGVDGVLDRFVRLGEGRTENIGGYTDGFSVWKRIYERGWRGLVRGDEAFGCRYARTPSDVYRNTRCNVLGDFDPDSVGPLAEWVPLQKRPPYLERRPAETLPAWRDRLNAQYELPYAIAPLNDLKYGYVDVVNPLVSRRIVEQVRRLPDELRTGKRAFKEVVEQSSLDVPFATRGAVYSPDVVLRHPQVLRAVSEELRRHGDGSDVVAALARHALERLPRSRQQGRALPVWLRQAVEKARRRSRALNVPRLNSLRVAFRVYIICKMQALLADDARALR